MFYKNIGSFARQDITQDSSSDSRKNSDRYKQKCTIGFIFGKCGLNSHHRKDTKPQRIHNQHDNFIRPVPGKELLYPRKKYHDRNCCRDNRINRILKHGRRGNSKHHIAQNTSTKSRAGSQNHNSKQIHLFAVSRYRS